MSGSRIGGFLYIPGIVKLRESPGRAGGLPRSNYLLALGPLLKQRGTEPLEIPVYLADSVMTPSRGDSDNLFDTDIVRVSLSIGKVELPLRLAYQRGVAALTNLLDEHLDKIPSTPPKNFTRMAEEHLKASYSMSNLKKQGLTPGQAWKMDEPTLAVLYAKLHDLHSKGRNGLWARINKLPRRKQRGIRKASAVDPHVIFGNQFPDV